MAMPCLYCLPDSLHGVQATAVMQARATFHSIMQPASLCPRQPAARQSVVASQQYYQTAVQRVAKVCKLSVSPDHRRRRELMLQSLSAFLHTELAGLGLDLQNCGPLEVLIFMSEHYVPQHSGSRLPNGSVQMAPNSVANSLSALSMGFQDMGRQRPSHPCPCLVPCPGPWCGGRLGAVASVGTAGRRIWSRLQQQQQVGRAIAPASGVSQTRPQQPN